MGDKKKKKGRSRKKVTPEQVTASKYINEWVFSDSSSDSNNIDSFLPLKNNKSERVVIDLHSHSKCSDGFLSPAAVVERGRRNGVKVLALTDHDTMAGIPEAMNVAVRCTNFQSAYKSGVKPDNQLPKSISILCYS